MDEVSTTSTQGQGINYPLNNQSSRIADISHQLCTICGDKVTGKHYGALACDGCKGFFRRSVRKNLVYTCRFYRSCVVDKDRRNQCRYCRLRKCFKAGMRKEAVQNERDKISAPRVNVETPHTEIDTKITLEHLLEADSVATEFLNYTERPDKHDTRGKPIANRSDLYNAMKHQLIVLVEWAKCIPGFRQLSMDDQVSMLRAHAGDHLLLGVAKRSAHLHDTLLIGHDFVLHRGSHNTESLISTRVMDLLSKPFRELNIDHVEYICLKALIFLDPTVVGSKSCEKIHRLRCYVETILEDYVGDRQYDSRGRLCELLLLFPHIKSISTEMIQQIHCVKILGMARVDKLLRELLLGEEDAEDETMGMSSVHVPVIASSMKYGQNDKPTPLTASGLECRANSSTSMDNIKPATEEQMEKYKNFQDTFNDSFDFTYA